MSGLAPLLDAAFAASVNLQAALGVLRGEGALNTPGARLALEAAASSAQVLSARLSDLLAINRALAETSAPAP